MEYSVNQVPNSGGALWEDTKTGKNESLKQHQRKKLKAIMTNPSIGDKITIDKLEEGCKGWKELMDSRYCYFCDKLVNDE